MAPHTLLPNPSLPPAWESVSLASGLCHETSPSSEKYINRPHFCHVYPDFFLSVHSIRGLNSPKSPGMFLPLCVLITLITLLITPTLETFQAIIPDLCGAWTQSSQAFPCWKDPAGSPTTNAMDEQHQQTLIQSHLMCLGSWLLPLAVSILLTWTLSWRGNCFLT